MHPTKHPAKSGKIIIGCSKLSKKCLNIFVGLVSRQAYLCKSVVILLGHQQVVCPLNDLSAINHASFKCELELAGDGRTLSLHFFTEQHPSASRCQNPFGHTEAWHAQKPPGWADFVVENVHGWRLFETGQPVKKKTEPASGDPTARGWESGCGLNRRWPG